MKKKTKIKQRKEVDYKNIFVRLIIKHLKNRDFGIIQNDCFV